jgi:transforming growth factor-beta-induced protein
MQKRIMLLASLCIALALVIAPLGQFALAQDGPEIIADGFNAPQGILVDPDGNIWVIDSGTGGDGTIEVTDPWSGEAMTATYGDTARVVKIDAADGSQTVVATLPSLLVGEEASGGNRLALLDGQLYATSGVWMEAMGDAMPNTAALVRIGADGQVTEAVKLWTMERRMNPDNTILESHPYGIAVGPDGKLWIADAGANTLVRVNPDAKITELVSVFPPVPGVFPNPLRNNELLADPVPTGITFDADGVPYVAYLSGAPFVPGSAKVVKIGANGKASDYATNLTMLTDLRTGPDGNMYAVQFALFGEEGPVPNSGAVVRVLEGEASEVVADGLSFPTSIDFNADGDAYVTINGAGPGGAGAVVLLANLTGAEAIIAEEAGEEMDAAVVGGPSVTVSDQESTGASVTVDSATVTTAGWLVIHADADGRPGPVLGQAALAPGTTENVVVMLDEPLDEDATVWAMLHVDEGQVGVYEFPGPDVPVQVEGMIAMSPIIVSVAGADEAEEAMDIVEIAASNDTFSTLVAAVQAAGLVEALQGEGPFTVFAPTNAAFDALPAGTIDALLGDPSGDLTQILLYHVVSGAVMAADVSDGLEAETLQGDVVVFTVNEDGVMINNANVILTDIVATNGIIHVIDAVLLPTAEEGAAEADEAMAEEVEEGAAEADEAVAEVTDIVDTAVAAGSFTTLVAAVEAAGLVDALKGEGPFTVFAPTDAAFAALPAGTIDALLADPSGDLTQILLYHVVSGAVMAADVSNGLEAETLQGQSLSFSIDGSSVMVNNANIIVTDIEASNGVIHVIDVVLLPPAAEASAAEASTPGASSTSESSSSTSTATGTDSSSSGSSSTPPQGMPNTGAAQNLPLTMVVTMAVLALFAAGTVVTRRRL